MSRNTIANIWRIMSLRCDEASQLISALQEHELPRTERWALSFHLLICRACRNYRRQLALLRSLLRIISQLSFHETAKPSAVSPRESLAMKKRILENIRKDRDSL